MNETVRSRILAVDAGNTRVKWGIHDGQEWFMRASFALRFAAINVALRRT